MYLGNDRVWRKVWYEQVDFHSCWRHTLLKISIKLSLIPTLDGFSVTVQPPNCLLFRNTRTLKWNLCRNAKQTTLCMIKNEWHTCIGVQPDRKWCSNLHLSALKSKISLLCCNRCSGFLVHTRLIQLMQWQINFFFKEGVLFHSFVFILSLWCPCSSFTWFAAQKNLYFSPFLRLFKCFVFYCCPFKKTPPSPLIGRLFITFLEL